MVPLSKSVSARWWAALQRRTEDHSHPIRKKVLDLEYVSSFQMRVSHHSEFSKMNLNHGKMTQTKNNKGSEVTIQSGPLLWMLPKFSTTQECYQDLVRKSWPHRHLG